MKFVAEHARGDRAQLATSMQSLAPYLQELAAAARDHAYGQPPSALATPSDESIRAKVLELVEQYSKVRTVILVGIGGSDLGTRAIYDAVSHSKQRERDRQLICFDTIEPLRLDAAEQLFATHDHPEEIALVVITKSGSTTETLINANVLVSQFTKRFGERAAHQTLVVTQHGSPLGERAPARGMQVVYMPEQVGGRFSVFSAVGLLPLALLGIDIRALCEGASAGVLASVDEEGKPTAAALRASLIFQAYTQGMNIHDMLLWHPELATLGRWYRQLLAESVGKSRADESRVGITPSILIGSTDLHSMGQLAFGGPRNRMTTMLTIPSLWDQHTPLAEDSVFQPDVPAGTSAGDVMRALRGGVQAAYRGAHMPYVDITLDGCTERELGAYMAFEMMTTILLARLLDVNAFDQPAVESYKQETRTILAEQAATSQAVA